MQGRTILLSETFMNEITTSHSVSLMKASNRGGDGGQGKCSKSVLNLKETIIFFGSR